MDTPLLKTKLYIPPVRPELVPRPRLIERLNAGLQRKLTLISAPAGFGKTALAAQWISDLQSPVVAWLSLDEDDNDPARFFTYLIAPWRRCRRMSASTHWPCFSPLNLPPCRLFSRC
jgi:LuxR family maltose regulon positive regulatory protein